MLKLSSSVDIPSVSQLNENESYTLHLNLEIPKAHITELLSYLNSCQLIPTSSAAAILEKHPATIIPESQIAAILHEIGVPAHIMGYRYLKDAIALSIRDRDCINSITKTIYPEVASLNNTTSSRVERSIRHAIEVTWTRGNMDMLDQIFGYTVNPNSGRPTNSEFIALISDRLYMQNQNGGFPSHILH